VLTTFKSQKILKNTETGADAALHPARGEETMLLGMTALAGSVFQKTKRAVGHEGCFGEERVWPD